MDFIKRWSHFLISTSIVAVVFLIWDALFTMAGIWGFNENYCLGLSILMMPLEEWLFCVVVPFWSRCNDFALQHSSP
ncbi:MAG: lycopene cyclase domain-containing protein, partial [Flavobacteriales bacterium]